jgi:putative glutathione S-transferase
MVRELKGLQSVIGLTVVLPTWKQTKPHVDTHSGWVFATTEDQPYPNTIGIGGPFFSVEPGCEPDPIWGAATVRELYEKAGDTRGLYSVPILWDKVNKTIVSNESSEIIQMLNSEFNDFASNPSLDLYPADLKVEIDEANKWVYDALNNGVYRCGFAKTQQAYTAAVQSLTAAFDKADGILQKQRYLAGDRLTLADIRLFATLVRFDEVYTVYFKCNSRMVTYTPALMNYCRELSQMAEIQATLWMGQIKQHYYTSHPALNNWSIIPMGNDFVAKLSEPHNRGALGTN